MDFVTRGGALRAEKADRSVPPPANEVAEAPWSVAEWSVALRFENPRATVLVLLLSDTLLGVLGFRAP